MGDWKEHVSGIFSTSIRTAATLFLALTLLAAAVIILYGVERFRQPERASKAEMSSNLLITTHGLPSDRARSQEEHPAPPTVGQVTQITSADLASEQGSISGLFRSPDAGKLYFQVAAAHRGVARILAIYLQREGLQTLVEEGPLESSYRVLAGPLTTESEVEQARIQLASLELEPFLRRIRGQD